MLQIAESLHTVPLLTGGRSEREQKIKRTCSMRIQSTQDLNVHIEREKHTHTHVHKQSHTAKKILIRHANCLPCVCLMDILCLRCQTHMESNSAHQKTSDSLYRRSFHFTLIQNRHTWRSTNRCTQAYTQSTSDPKYLQNKQRKNSRHFFSPLPQRESTAASHRHQTEQFTWQNGSNGPNLLSQLQWARTHTHTHAQCVNMNIRASSIWFLKAWWHTTEWHAEKQKREGEKKK